MKKILMIFLILIFTSNYSIAEVTNTEDIDKYFEEAQQTEELNGYLEYNNQAQQHEENSIELSPATTTGINITKPSAINAKSLITESKKANLTPIQDTETPASRFSSQEYDLGSINAEYSQNYGKFKIGTTYGSFIDSAQINYTTSFYTKYEGKNWAMTAGMTKYTDSNYNSFDNRIYIAPELKLTKRLSLLDVMQSDVLQPTKKNEVVLRYSPRFHSNTNDIKFEVGAGQTFYNDQYVKSTLKFSTRFKI